LKKERRSNSETNKAKQKEMEANMKMNLLEMATHYTEVLVGKLSVRYGFSAADALAYIRSEAALSEEPAVAVKEVEPAAATGRGRPEKKVKKVENKSDMVEETIAEVLAEVIAPVAEKPKKKVTTPKKKADAPVVAEEKKVEVIAEVIAEEKPKKKVTTPKKKADAPVVAEEKKVEVIAEEKPKKKVTTPKKKAEAPVVAEEKKVEEAKPEKKKAAPKKKADAPVEEAKVEVTKPEKKKAAPKKKADAEPSGVVGAAPLEKKKAAPKKKADAPVEEAKVEVVVEAPVAELEEEALDEDGDDANELITYEGVEYYLKLDDQTVYSKETKEYAGTWNAATKSVEFDEEVEYEEEE
jgi:hypothetical protein